MAKRSKSKKWFAIKSLYRTEITDPPRVTDADYDPEGTLIEERVVLVRARSHEKALLIAEAEADDYCRLNEHINPYGQRVVWGRLGSLESFKLFEAPGNLREAWSSMSVVPASLKDEELENQRFGPDEPAEALRLRKKYLNCRFSGEVVAPPSEPPSSKS